LNTTEHARRSPAVKTGLFAPLSGLLSGGGSGAPSLRLLGLALVLVAGFIAVVASPASAKQIHVFKSSFGEQGHGAGQLELQAANFEAEPKVSPSGVALNEATGDVYVADTGNRRVDQFDEAGNFIRAFGADVGGPGVNICTTTCVQGTSTSAPGGFEEPTHIAIDNNPASESFEGVYVTDNGHSVIDKFKADGTYLGQITEGESGNPFGTLYGLATDPEGKVWVFQASGEVDHYSAEEPNVFSASCTDPRGTSPGFAVDSADNLYLNTGNKIFAKFDSTCTTELIFSVGTETTSAGAVDPETNDLYVDNLTSLGRFNPSAELLDTFGEGHLTEGAGLAVNSGSAEKLLYVADQGAGEVRVFKQVAIPDVTTEAATEVKAHSARLNGTVIAVGGEATCRFAWGTTPVLTETPIPCAAPIAAGTTEAVHVTLSTQPNTTYFFRLEAENANGLNEGEASETREFTTPGPAAIEATFATEVSADSATLGAQIALHGVPTTYRFEYGTTTAYGTKVPIPDGALGAGKGTVEVAQHLQGLEPGATYHYRVIVASEIEPGVFTEEIGPDRTFTTQATTTTLLPDHRAWELVSPSDKRGALLLPTGEQNGPVQAAAGGGAVTYPATAPTEAQPQGNANITQVLSARGSGGWQSRDLNPPHQALTGVSVGQGKEYRFFSTDLSHAVLQPLGAFEPSLSPEATEQTPYLRTNFPAADPAALCTSSCYRPLVTAANVSPPAPNSAKTANAPPAPQDVRSPAVRVSSVPPPTPPGS
jgi:NHL repeat